jgi:hypothetical protein
MNRYYIKLSVSSGDWFVLKKQSLILLFLLALSLVVTYQNCGQTEQSNLFNSSCSDAKCTVNPNSLAVSLDLELVPGGALKISTNPVSGFNNLKLTGTCEPGGFTKNLVKAKIYQCSGSTCNTLKFIDAVACSVDKRFNIESSITNLTPGPYKLNLEIVGINEFGQEVYGPNSKLAPINVVAQQTILPPVLATFVGANQWAQDKIYYEENSTAPNKIIFDGRIQGFCDYNTSNPLGNNISVKLSFKGDSKGALLANTTCNPVSGNSSAQGSPNRAGRTGYFDIPSFSIYYSYGQNLATCESSDANCLNNSLNLWTSRLIALSFYQKDITFDYEVSSARNLILHFKNINYGNGWLADALQETLKRIKKSFYFAGSDYAGTLNGTQSSTNDFTTAVKILTSSQELYDPLASANYGYGTRAYIVRWLLGAVEDTSTEFPAGNIYFLGTSNTVPYKKMATATTCDLNPSMSDPIKGVTGTQYSTDAEVERIAVCLGHRYLNGLWNRTYSDTKRMVTEGVTYLNNSTCFYRNGGAIPSRDCSELLLFLEYASKMKSRHLLNVSISAAADPQLKYFSNGLTQAYINRLMDNLKYRDGSGENEYFLALFQTMYPTVTDAVLRKNLYPDEINYVGATPAMRFYGTRTKPLPDGSYTY